ARSGDGGERSPLLVGTPPKGVGRARVAVLAVAGLERAAFVGITTNLGLYLASTFGWGGTHGARASSFFLGASALLSPVGGWFADVYLGCYGTVLLSFSVALLVAALLPVTSTLDGRLSLCGQPPTSPIQNCSWQRSGTCPGQPLELYCGPTIYTGLLLLALGVSSFRANLTPFGADQVKDRDGDATRSFFNWFYWSTNAGAIFSVLVVAFVQQNISFLAGYLIPVACLALALLIFLLATPTFVTKPPTGSQVSAMIKLALKNCGCGCPGLSHTVTLPRLRTPRWEAGDLLDNNRAQPGAPSPEEDLANFQVLSRILPVMLTFIPYWMVYFQVRCGVGSAPGRGTIGGGGSIWELMFPDAWLLLTNVVVLLALVPLKDHVIDPFLARRKLLPSALKQMTLGLFFSLTSILAAGRTRDGVGCSYRQRFGGFSAPCPHPTGILERERLRYVHRNQTVPQLLGKNLYVAATLPIWWQVPQYLLLGIGEVFTSIPALEFSYTEAPESMRGATMGLFFFTSGLGSLLGSGLLTLLSLPTHGWTRCPKDSGSINRCRLDNYLFLLGGIQSITCLLFSWVSRRYRSQE
ncbi:S15A3 protein, partial [Halcyon senegalensis]|nr:S15A3 protein [Halcyon senegalensis]